MSEHDGDLVWLALGNDELARMSDEQVRARVRGFLAVLGNKEPEDVAAADIDALLTAIGRGKRE